MNDRNCERFSRWNASDYLKSEEDIAAYLEAASVEGADDPTYMAEVRADIAEARARVAINQ